MILTKRFIRVSSLCVFYFFFLIPVLRFLSASRARLIAAFQVELLLALAHRLALASTAAALMPLPWCRNLTALRQDFWSNMGYLPPFEPVFLRALAEGLPLLVLIPLFAIDSLHLRCR
jgi:hypothetical protein